MYISNICFESPFSVNINYVGVYLEITVNMLHYDTKVKSNEYVFNYYKL